MGVRRESKSVGPSREGTRDGKSPITSPVTTRRRIKGEPDLWRVHRYLED